MRVKGQKASKALREVRGTRGIPYGSSRVACNTLMPEIVAKEVLLEYPKRKIEIRSKKAVSRKLLSGNVGFKAVADHWYSASFLGLTALFKSVECKKRPGETLRYAS